MTKIIGVRFRNNGRVYFFDPGLLDIHEGDSVVVETAHGIEMGYVARGVSEVEDSEVVAPLVPVLRVATAEDHRLREMYTAKEPEAFELCAQKIEQHKLDMKLVRVEYAFNGSKVVFYFTADERVDFRDLVKDLAFQFRTRIELRQIGVRDEAKMLGGLGPCGRPICCKQFLDDFSPVSIKMAKEQNLSLSPTKISGLCGRLMCCLQYEEYAYEEMKKLMPRVGKDTITPDGLGTVLENNAITELTKVKIQLSDGSFDQRWYHYSFLHKPGEVPVARQDAAVSTATVKTEAATDASSSAQTAVPSERRRHGNGQRRVADNPVEAGADKTGAANTEETANTNAGRDNRRRRRPQRPQNTSAGVSDAPSSAVSPAMDKASPSPSEGENAVSGETVKRRRHRGGRKHRPRNPDGATNSNAPQDE